MKPSSFTGSWKRAELNKEEGQKVEGQASSVKERQGRLTGGGDLVELEWGQCDFKKKEKKKRDEMI